MYPFDGHTYVRGWTKWVRVGIDFTVVGDGLKSVVRQATTWSVRSTLQFTEVKFHRFAKCQLPVRRWHTKYDQRLCDCSLTVHCPFPDPISALDAPQEVHVAHIFLAFT